MKRKKRARHTSLGATLSVDEKRRLLARAVRFNAFDCLDASGSFDPARARRVLPGIAVRSLYLRESTRSNRQGVTTVRRSFRLLLVDRLRAMRLDERIRQREEKRQARHAAKAEANAEIIERRADAVERARECLREMLRQSRAGQQSAQQAAEAVTPDPAPVASVTPNESAAAPARRPRSIPVPEPPLPHHLDPTIPGSFASQGVVKYV